MYKITPPDSHLLKAAQGWLELGNHLEANEELDKIPAESRDHFSILDLRWRICAKAEKWVTCLDIAMALKNLAPGRLSGWLICAESLHQLKRTAEAREVLLEAVPELLSHSSLPCSLACYCARLGKTSKAESLVGAAFMLAASSDEKKGNQATGADGAGNEAGVGKPAPPAK
jgi:predicted Zn-dependent protease